MAAINHPAFQSSFKTHSSPTSPFIQGIFSNSLIFYLPFNPSFSLSFPFINNALLLKNQSTKFLLEILKENIQACSSFITKNISPIQELFFYFERVPGGFFRPFEQEIPEILLGALKAGIILPCMAIPFILVRSNCLYLFRNHKESCLNCLNDCLLVLRKRTRRSLTVTDQLVDVPLVADLFDFELAADFLHFFIHFYSLKSLLEKIDYQNDPLVIFIVLRSLRKFNRKDKELFIKHILENVVEEGLFRMVEEAKRFYERSSRGVLPVDILFH